jgi:hypothetical protein
LDKNKANGCAEGKYMCIWIYLCIWLCIYMCIYICILYAYMSVQRKLNYLLARADKEECAECKYVYVHMATYMDTYLCIYICIIIHIRQ